MTALSPIQVISTIVRARLRGEPLAPNVMDRLARSASRHDVAWVRTASRHRIGPALGACLRDLGIQNALPADLALYFDAIRAGNDEQNACFLEELAVIVEALNAQGFEPCLLKGAAVLVAEVFPEPSWRFMNDVDLLLPERQVERAWNALRALGYQVYEGVVDDEAHHHEKPLWHPDRLAYVELHRRIGRPRHSRIMPASSLLERSRSIDHPVIGRVRLPHANDLATCLIAHAQIFDAYDRYGLFRLIDLVELDVLVARERVELEKVADRFRQVGWSGAFETFASLGDRLLNTPAVRSLPIAPDASRSARRAIWRQDRRPALLAGIFAGWTLRMAERLVLDGEWRRIGPWLTEILRGEGRPLSFSLKRALRTLS